MYGYHLFGIGSGAYEEAAEANNMVAKYGEEGPDPADYGVWVPGIPALIESGLDAINCADWLKGLILDGIVAGVGAVLGLQVQLTLLVLLQSLLQELFLKRQSRSWAMLLLL